MGWNHRLFGKQAKKAIVVLTLARELTSIAGKEVVR